jgi:hypothetical protein
MDIFKLLILSCLVGLASCASVPTQEMADARAELKAAEEIGAKDSLGETWSLVKRDMAAAEQKLELGDYGQARAFAVKAREGATKARTITHALSRAHQVVERARAGKVLWTVAEDSYRAALAASRNVDVVNVVAAADRAEQFVVLGENQAALETAKLIVESCPEAKRAAHAEWLIKAAEAIAGNRGNIATEFAQKACR